MSFKDLKSAENLNESQMEKLLSIKKLSIKERPSKLVARYEQIGSFIGPTTSGDVYYVYSRLIEDMFCTWVLAEDPEQIIWPDLKSLVEMPEKRKVSQREWDMLILEHMHSPESMRKLHDSVMIDYSIPTGYEKKSFFKRILEKIF